MRRRDVKERASFLAFQVYMADKGMTSMNSHDLQLMRAEALFWNRIMPSMEP